MNSCLNKSFLLSLLKRDERQVRLHKFLVIFRRRTCVEHLPTVIFQIIQLYLSLQEYRNLLCCNKATFTSVKHETLLHQLDLTKLQRAIGINCLDENKRHDLFNDFIKEKVKDKAKQLCIKMKQRSTAQQIPTLSPHFQGIYQLSLHDVTNLGSSLDFNLFNNINSVKLHNFEGIESISSGFENVKILEIIDFPLLTSLTIINTSESLQSLTVLRAGKLIPEMHCLSLFLECPNLTEFTSMGHLHDMDSFKRLQSMSNVKKLTVNFPEITVQELLTYSPVCSSSLSWFALGGKFEDFQDVTFLENVSDLYLINVGGSLPSTVLNFFDLLFMNSSMLIFPSIVLDRFFGRSLHLYSFDVLRVVQAMSNESNTFPT